MKTARKKIITDESSVDPLWYKDAIIYQIHVRAFNDSNGDGIGDFPGLTQKLDYIRDLGATALWLLPFYPSPLRDDGYDIADYNGIHPSYGTLADFREFMREAHARGLRVITELVVNHTSDQHAWFQRARRAAPGSAHRDFYVWSDDNSKYSEARIIFKDFEASNWAWDPVAKSYFWHRFYSHQPDLNFDNPAVRLAIRRVMDQWFAMGVDGLRLDAVPYLHEREGTSCENLPETHEELRLLRKHIDSRYPGKMLLAEANQWPEDAVAYFGDGDECHMAFHFPLMPRMFMAARMEDRYPIVDILAQTPAIPENCQWAVFLRNHDELTLEMVTDEERDYMYRVYAHDPQARINLGIRRRLAPLLGNDRRRIELMNGLLFSMPGTPVLYYGDELGMGDNIYLGDRNGVRTPMQWSPDRSAGFSRANPQRLYLPAIIDPTFSYENINVETQHDNASSLLWWMRRLIALRKRYRCLGRGSLDFLYPSNRRVLVFIRTFGEERMLVVANLSRHVQAVELELGRFAGMIPVEAFGRAELPPIGKNPYFLTLGPHAFYWLALEPARPTGSDVHEEAGPLPLRRMSVAPKWDAILKGRGRTALEELLPTYLVTRRWFAGKSRDIRAVQIEDAIPVAGGGKTYQYLLLRVEYVEGDPETYGMPLGIAVGEAAEKFRETWPHAVLAELGARGEEGVLHGAAGEPAFARALLDVVSRRRRLKATGGELVGVPTRALKSVLGDMTGPLDPELSGAEQSNTSIIFGRRAILKLIGKLETGPNPETELGGFLTERTAFKNAPPLLGSLEYRSATGESTSMGVLLAFVENEGDAWRYSLDSLSRYFERVATRSGEEAEVPEVGASVIELSQGDLSETASSVLGVSLESARLLGQRVAEMHLALVSQPADPVFAPEPFTPIYQRSLYQSMRNLNESVFATLRRKLPTLPDDVRSRAEGLLARQAESLGCFKRILSRNLSAKLTRHHGDLHLGQVLWTGRDFVIIDFEGEPARPLSTRRLKRSPLRDVAGMIRSYNYAAFHALNTAGSRGLFQPQELERISHWAEFWYTWVSSAFLRSYVRSAEGAIFLPESRDELNELLSVYLLEKAIYELGYEFNNRPDWVWLPLRGVLRLLDAEAGAAEGR